MSEEELAKAGAPTPATPPKAPATPGGPGWTPDFIHQHYKTTNAATTRPPHSPPPNLAYRGVAAKIGPDNFFDEHVKTLKKATTYKQVDYVGIKPNLSSDDYLTSLMKKSKENMLATKYELRPQVCDDDMMLAHHKANTYKIHTSPERPGVRSREGSPTPKIDAQAMAVAGLRVTKAQTPPPRGAFAYNGGKTTMGADSFTMTFYKNLRVAMGVDRSRTTPEARVPQQVTV